jgi:serine/threonine-protein kinase
VLQFKRGDSNTALVTLTAAAAAYQKLGYRLGSAQVQDGIGMIHAEQGRLDCALQAFSVSLADKTIDGDFEGMAITLGNLGRTHLRAMRYQDALDCFQRDMDLAVRFNALKSQAQLHNHLGQAWLGLKELDQAAAALEQSLELARTHGYSFVELFALKDRALLHLSQRRFKEAEADLIAAEKLLPSDTEPDLVLHLKAARGELLAARGDRGAAALLEQAANGYANLQVPDLLINCRVRLAHTLIDANNSRDAQQCLLDTMELVRAGGYGRYLTMVREAFAGLGVVEPVAEESRTLAATGTAAAPGDYQELQHLGGGAFGEVFRAMDFKRNCQVAYKRLHLNRLYDVRERQLCWASARTELEAASRVCHPCVASVYSLGTEPNGGAYVVQQFIEGRPLTKLLPPDNSANELEVMRSLKLIADGLSALHLADIVHRDLKPDNIIVRPDGVPVLIDFGVAHVTRFTSRTMPKIIAGTFGYMAPEQAAGKAIDARADLYALGVIAFQWLTGILPLRPRGTTFEEQAADVAKRAPDALRDFRPNVQPPLHDLVMSLLEKKPRRRPASAVVVARQLQEMLDAADGQAAAS